MVHKVRHEQVMHVMSMMHVVSLTMVNEHCLRPGSDLEQGLNLLPGNFQGKVALILSHYMILHPYMI